MMKLSPLGTVRTKMGAAAVTAKEVPAWLVEAGVRNDLDVPSLHLAWELAELSDAPPREREALMALVVVTLLARREGSSCVAIGSLGERFERLGAESDLVEVAKELLARAGDEDPLIGGLSDYKPLVVDRDHLYHQAELTREVSLAERFKARLAAKPDFEDYSTILDALDRVLAHAPLLKGKAMRLSAEQQHAIRSAITRNVSVIAGGPGSGKTSIIVSVLRVLSRMEFSVDRVALAAPTGKAAKRMDASIHRLLDAVPEPKILDASLAKALPRAVTLHKLLGVTRHGRSVYGEDRHLPHQLVIVDEASMIDLTLADRLLAALRPAARLILLGDQDQLPSVETGSVFRDLAAGCGTQAVVTLQGSFRTDAKDPGGRNIYRVARRIRSEKLPDLFEASRGEGSILVRDGARSVEFRGVEILEDDRQALLDRWLRERVMTAGFHELCRRQPLDDEAIETIFAHLGSHRILTVTRRDAERINQAFALRRPQGVAEPVVVLRNDDQRGLSNGDEGVALSMGVVFRSGAQPVRFDPRTLSPPPGRAYAMTIHKSQGSEFDHVAVVLPEPKHPMLNRELLYTAVTRARKSVTLLGPRESISTAAGRSLERSSGLSERLA